MSLEEIKESYSNYSAKTLLVVVFGILAPLGGTVYVGITTYNRVIAATEMIEANKPYDDTRSESTRLNSSHSDRSRMPSSA